MRPGFYCKAKGELSEQCEISRLKGNRLANLPDCITFDLLQLLVVAVLTKVNASPSTKQRQSAFS